MTLAQYINDPVLQSDGVDLDDVFGKQCWDLAEDYAERVLCIPKEPWAIPLGPTGSAHEAWTDYENNAHMKKWFDKVPAGQQLPGDIMVYGPHGPYTEGHIAINVIGNTVFEQNADPDGSLPHQFNRASTYLLGALRKKGPNMPTLTAAELKDYQTWKAEAIRLTNEVIPAMEADKKAWVERALKAEATTLTRSGVLDYITKNLK